MSRISAERQLERVKFGQSIRKNPEYIGCCEVCGWRIDKVLGSNSDGLEIHHIIPVSKGGTDTIDNTIVLCPNHHKMIHCVANDEVVKETKTEIKLALSVIDDDVSVYVKSKEAIRSAIRRYLLDELLPLDSRESANNRGDNEVSGR